MAENMHKRLEAEMERIKRSGATPSLLLHSCCAPCSSYVVEYLTDAFDITIYYDNPNIEPEAEYQKRKEEQKRFLSVFPARQPVRFLEAAYQPADFLAAAAGLEQEKERGARCRACYALRMRRTAIRAQALGLDYFGTTLSVSPHKDAQAINDIGAELEKEYGVAYLYADFKKNNGYARSVALAGAYGLYRQRYCGCRYSYR